MWLQAFSYDIDIPTNKPKRPHTAEDDVRTVGIATNKRFNVWFSIQSKSAGKSRSGDKGKYRVNKHPVSLVQLPMFFTADKRQKQFTNNKCQTPTNHNQSAL